ncbi:fibronectin type III domain-containing protein [Paenibacillus contaminans]|uniref:fibronectin type III domain-containing protein n=1 Tax=Paenibacillus contaminans TaxID=450362 RepID=UPI0013143243|nr:fibronectin type III domain-containing protein [Paenibacillus contaminans]
MIPSRWKSRKVKIAIHMCMIFLLIFGAVTPAMQASPGLPGGGGEGGLLQKLLSDVQSGAFGDGAVSTAGAGDETVHSYPVAVMGDGSVTDAVYGLLASQPDDPMYAQQWALGAVEAEAAWDTVGTATYSPAPVVVAVIAGGFDAGHPDLAGKLYPAIDCTGSGETPCGGSEEGILADGEADDAESGTHAAGIIAAIANNGIGMAGAAGTLPVSILPVHTAADELNVAAAAEKALDWSGPSGERVSVIYIGYGFRSTYAPSYMSAVLLEAHAKGITVVTGAGDDGLPVRNGGEDAFYPAALPNVISVGAVNQASAPLPGSNPGADVQAPGEQILGTLPGGQYGAKTGTAAAAAYVAAASALLRSAIPSLTADEVRQAILAGTGGTWSMNRALLAVVPDRNDKTPPVWPSGSALHPAEAGHQTVRLEWPAAGGETGLVRYVLIQDGRELDGFVQSPFTVRGLTPDTQYGFKVEAVDRSGNRTSDGPAVTVRTKPPIATEKISVSSGGSGSEGNSRYSSMSEDGRWVAFSSEASNLIEGDTNGKEDVFIRDRESRTTKRISAAPSGAEADGGSFAPIMSPDRRFVLFASQATNLLDTPDNNALEDLFLYDNQTGRIEKVAENVSAGYMYTYDRPYGLSENGRYVAFASYGANGVAEDENNNWDVFVKDRWNDTVTRITDRMYGSVKYPQTTRVSITPNGRFVAFTSDEAQLVPDDTNGKKDVFVYDTKSGQTERVSVSSAGEEGDSTSQNAAISADGRYVAFASYARNFIPGDDTYNQDIFVRDRVMKTTEIVSVKLSGEPSFDENDSPWISANGRWVAFHSDDELQPDAYYKNIYMHDRITRETELLSVSAAGEPGDRDSMKGVISLSGKYAAFDSLATNLLAEPEEDDYLGGIYFRELPAKEQDDRNPPDWGPGASLSASLAGGSYIALTWTPAQDEAGPVIYKVYRDGVLHDIVAGTAYLAEGLSNGTAYTFKVEPGDSSYNWSKEALSVSASTLSKRETNPPGKADDIALQPNLGSMIVRWNDPGDPDLARLQVKWRKKGADAFKEGPLLPAGMQQAQLNGLVNGTEYEVVVEGIDADGNRSTSDSVTARLPHGQQISSINLSDSGKQGNGPGTRSDISDDGRYIVFDSDSSNLVERDTNGKTDVFLYDRITDRIRLISKTAGGASANNLSFEPKISGDGRYIVFSSYADDLTADDDNGFVTDVYMYDRETDAVTKISRTATGASGDDDSFRPAISDDGSVIAFISYAKLVPGAADQTNLYLYHRESDSLSLLQLVDGTAPNADSEAPALSGNGQYVAFATEANNLDTGDTDNDKDIYLYHIPGKTAKRISSLPGEQTVFYDPAISADGRFVAFLRENYGDWENPAIYLYDRDRDETKLASRSLTGVAPDDSVGAPSISVDGRYVAYATRAADIHEADKNFVADIYVYDRQTGETKPASLTYKGGWGNGSASMPAISGDGAYIVFQSEADNLIFGDVNKTADIFLVSTQESPQEDTVPPVFPAGGSAEVKEAGAEFIALAWTPAEDDRAVAGYRIYYGDNPYESFPGTGTTGTVWGLKPGTEYVFTVKAVDAAGNESATGLTAVATTKTEIDVRLQDVRATIAKSGSGYASVGGQLAVEAEGSPGGEAAARIDYVKTDGTTDSAEVPLAASNASSPIYKVTYTVPEGVKQILSVHVSLAIGGVTAELDKVADIPVGGTLKLGVRSEDGARLKDAVLTVRDKGQNLTEEIKLSGNGVYAFEGLPAGDYEVKLRSSLGRELPLREERTYTVRQGLTEETTIHLKVFLSVAYVPGGRAEVTWTIPSDETGIAGFAVYRRTGAADPVLAGTVNDPAAVSFTDTGLLSDTQYAYYVMKKTGSGTEVPFSDEVSIRTSNLSIADPAWNVETIRVGATKHAVSGSSLQVRFRSEANRYAKMTVAYKSWFDESGKLLDEPVVRTKDVPMTPDTGIPGGYNGAFPLDEGITEVRGVNLSVTDDSGRSAERQVDGLYMQVTGTLKVNVHPIPDDFGPNDAYLTIRGQAYSTWRSVAKAGGGLEIPLPAGKNYSFTIVGSHQTVVWNKEGIAVKNGLPTEAYLEPQAKLRITVLDRSGAPLPDVKYVLRGKRGWVEQGKTGPDGIIANTKAAFVGETVTLTTDMADQPAYLPVTSSFVLDKERNETTVSPQAKPSGSLSGNVLDPQGKPTSDAVVHIYNESFRSAVNVDASGRFSLDVPAGSVTVEAVGKANANIRSKPVRLDIAEGGTVQRDVKLLNMDARVAINLYTRLPGGTWQGPLDLDWRVAIHFRIYSSHSILEYGDPARVRAQEGDTVKICADGVEAGLPKACAETVIDENKAGKIDIYLESAGSAVTGSIEKPDGLPLQPNYRGDLYRTGDNGNQRYVTTLLLNSESFKFDVSEAGAYKLYVSDNPNRPTAAQTVHFQVAAGESKALGQIRLDGSGKFAGRNGSGIQIMSGSAAPGSLVQVRATYANSGEPRGAAERAVLLVELPEGTSFVPDTVAVNGQAGPANEAGRTVEIPLGTIAANATGSIQFQLALDDAAYHTEPSVTARLRYAYEGAEREELLGAARVETVPVTIEAPSVVTGPSFKVNGKAPAGKPVTVFDGNVPLGHAVGSSSGLWHMSVQLPETGMQEHRLRAETEIGGQQLSSGDAIVKVDPEAAVLEQMSMMQANGRKVTFNPSEGQAKFPYVVVPNVPFLFELTFSQPERIRDVTVQMGQNLVSAQLVDGVYKATIATTNDIGPVWVSYRTKPKWNPDNAEKMPTEEQFRNRLPASMKDYVIDSVTVPDDLMNAVIDGTASSVKTATIKSRVSSDMNANAQFTVQRLSDYEPTSEERKQAEYSGLPAYGASVGYSKNANSLVVNFSINIPADELKGEGGFAAGLRLMEQALNGKGEEHAKVIALSAKSETIRLALRLTLDALTDHVPDVMGLIDRLKSLKDIAGASDLFKKAEELLIRAQNLCDPQASEYYTAWAEGIGRTIMIHESIKWALQAAGLVLGPETLGLGTAFAFWLSGLLAENVLDSMVESELNELEKYLNMQSCKVKPVPPKKKPQADPKYIWDPSGYVYEGIPDNRVQDVTATALEQDPVTGEWHVWDAEWYGQSNPQLTNADGRYGWDVPQGRWQVMYEKEGYETAYSHEMEVPPPHFDVNIPLVSYRAPEVEYAIAQPGGTSVDIYFSKPVSVDDLAPDSITVVRGGETVTGGVYGIDPVTVNGRSLAQGIRFLPEAPLETGQTYELTVSRSIASYAGIPLAADVRRSVLVTDEDRQAPSDVSGVLDGIAGHDMTLAWNDPRDPDFDKVRVYYKKSSDPDYGTPIEVSGGTKWAMIGDLHEGFAYQFRLAAVDSSGNESAGVTLNRTIGASESVDNTPPLPVLDLKAAGTEADLIRLAWTDPAAPDLAKVKLAWKPANGSGSAQTAQVEPSVGTYTITGLSADTVYEIRLTSTDKSGNESVAVTITAQTKTAQPKPDPGNGTGGGGTGGGGTGGTGSTGGGGGSQPNTPKPPARIEWAIDEKGGTFSAYDGMLELAVKEGAVSAGGKLTVTKSGDSASKPGSGYTAMSPVYGLDFGSFTAKRPVTLLIDYDAALAKGWNVERLGIYRQDERQPSGWTYVGGVVEPKEHRVRTDISEAGQYAVLLYDRPFGDLQGHWSVSEVEVLVSRHLVDGVSPDRFEPDRSITRAEMTKLLVETLVGAGLLKLEAPGTPSFRDVAANEWYYAYVEAAARAGIAEGADGQFRPGDDVTREEIAMLVLRTAEKLSGGKPQPEANDALLEKFDDYPAISGWARAGMAKAVGMGLLQGVSEKEIQPQAEATRAQAVVLIWRMLHHYKRISE